MSIRFCHIAPTPHLDLTESNGAHLLLAHLIEESDDYAEYYADLDDGKTKIMDCSTFEMFKQGREMYPSDKLIEMGRRVGADTIVMSDYPKEPASKTIEAAKRLNGQFGDAGFSSFFVPQSQLGDKQDYLQAVEWALSEENIDLIGLSILGCPVALGLDESPSGKRSDAYKMQRFLSRWKVLRMLDHEGLLDDERAAKRFHCLGMVDGPNEIELLRDYHNYIFSWDSSAAVWAGLNGIFFDESPTGLMNGKFEDEVDFSFQTTNPFLCTAARSNIEYINKLCNDDGGK